MKIYSRIIMSVFLLVFVYGCATQMPATMNQSQYQNKPWKERKVNLSGKQSWNIQGAVSVQVQNKTQMGTFAWQQRQQNYGIQIFGPLNLASVALQGGPGYVALWKSGHKFVAQTPEQLMQQQLGWYLPISNLYYWVRGLPAPMPCTEEHDNYGHLVHLVQQGWEIQFKEFESVDGVDLPRKIYLSTQNIRAKLVITHWNLF